MVSPIDGNLTYLRDYFPGQPFRKNKFNKAGLELPICTPAIDGSGISKYHIYPSIYSIIIFILFLICILL